MLLLLSLFAIAGASPANAQETQEGKIALIQYNGDEHFDDSEANIRNLTFLAGKAIGNGAKIIVFPEGSTYGYATADSYWCAPNAAELAVENYASVGPDPIKCRDIRKVAENIPAGPSSVYWSKIAKTEGVYIIFSIPEAGEDGKFYNALGIAHPSGEVTKYRKRVLYLTDKYYASRGEKQYTLETPYGKFGILICKDLTFPRDYPGQKPIDTGLIEEAHDLGLKAVIASMNWDKNPPSSDSQWVGFRWFKRRSTETGVTLYISDNTKWDATGFYQPGQDRIRSGLADSAEGVTGISYHSLSAAGN